MSYKKNTGTSSNEPVYTSKTVTNKVRMELEGNGLRNRLRRGNLPEIISQGSLHTESKNITTTERSVGMPEDSPENLFYKLPSAGQIQLSSSSINDTTGGTGAITVEVTGLKLDGDDWLDTSEIITLNGRTAVTSSLTDWYRVNFLYVYTTGTSLFNEGDIYVSPAGQSLTNGIPDTNVIAACLSNFGASSMGDYSVGSNRLFHFVKGNFFIDSTKRIIFRERYRQDTTGDGILNEYQVGYYPVPSISYGYEGAGPYTAKTDILLTVFTGTGTATYANYYVEFALCDTSFINTTPAPIFTPNQ